MEVFRPFVCKFAGNISVSHALLVNGVVFRVFQEVHSPLVKGIVDFKYHRFKLTRIVVKIPEGNRVK